jgi:hypothetical protein
MQTKIQEAFKKSKPSLSVFFVVICAICGLTTGFFIVLNTHTLASTPTPPTISISEIMSCPTTGNREWIELERSQDSATQLPNTSAFSLAGYKLEDDKAIIWTGTDTVPEPGPVTGGSSDPVSPSIGGYFAPNDPYTTITFTKHYLNNTGDILKLWSPTGELLEQATIPACSENGKSWTFNDGNWSPTSPTPGQENPSPPTNPTPTPSPTATQTSAQTPTPTNTSAPTSSQTPIPSLSSNPSSKPSSSPSSSPSSKPSSSLSSSPNPSASSQSTTSPKPSPNSTTSNTTSAPTSLTSESEPETNAAQTSETNSTSNLTIPQPASYIAKINQNNHREQSKNGSQDQKNLQVLGTIDTLSETGHSTASASIKQNSNQHPQPNPLNHNLLYSPDRSIFAYLSAILGGALLTTAASLMAYRSTRSQPNTYTNNTT